MLCFFWMQCPFCGSDQNKVIDKREVAQKGEIRRRRECLKCGKRFTTYEVLAKLKILVIKKDGRREIYSQEKLRLGVMKALEKRPGIEKAPQIIAKIEGKLRLKGLQEVSSMMLGRWVLGELKKIDAVAYLRFASVYNRFQTASDFERELQNL